MSVFPTRYPVGTGDRLRRETFPGSMRFACTDSSKGAIFCEIAQSTPRKTSALHGTCAGRDILSSIVLGACLLLVPEVLFLRKPCRTSSSARSCVGRRSLRSNAPLNSSAVALRALLARSDPIFIFY
jgi:hypothetical protein